MQQAGKQRAFGYFLCCNIVLLHLLQASSQFRCVKHYFDSAQRMTVVNTGVLLTFIVPQSFSKVKNKKQNK